ncbi:MAG: hypothetical protein EON87_13645 [Brevundimonas sp.]|nr:MAG: hypothetical protein EON87_13645 [Brevundimonas sp.]
MQPAPHSYPVTAYPARAAFNAWQATWPDPASPGYREALRFHQAAMEAEAKADGSWHDERADGLERAAETRLLPDRRCPFDTDESIAAEVEDMRSRARAFRREASAIRASLVQGRAAA